MDYKERLKRYKEGKLNEDERRELEEEIQKIKDISDFVYNLEEGEEEFSANVDFGVNKIKGAVNKKFIKAGTITGIIVIVIVCFLVFGLSPLVDKMYYDPSKQINEYTYNIDIPLNIYSDLYNVGSHYTGSIIEHKGFGKYDIKMDFSGFETQKTYHTTLERGKFDEISFRQIFQDQDIYTNSFDKIDNKEDDEEYIKELKKLPRTCYVKAAVVLKNDISLLKFETLKKKYGDIFSYVAVNGGNQNSNEKHIGFSPDFYGILIEKGSYDEEKYPGLTGEDMENAEQWELHYKSALKYLINDEAFLATMPDGDEMKENYHKALNYAEKNGVKVYAMVVYTSPNKILKLKEDPSIDNISILDVRVSQYAQ